MPDIKRPQRDSAHRTDTYRPMGLGKIGGANMVFVRKFRFSLEGSHLEDWSIKAVGVDLAKKQLRIKGYEVIETGDTNKFRTPNVGKDAPIEVWAQGLSEGRWPNEVLMLTTFDGCGKELYRYVFEGLKLTSRKLDFNMATSDESCQRVTVSFDTYRREFMLSQPAKFQWRFLLEGAIREIDVEMDGRPNIDIEETPIDFKHGKMWLPGKSKWQSLNMRVKVEDVPSLVKLINSGANESYTAGVLKFYDAENKHRETWTVGGLWAKGFDRHEETATIKMAFDRVTYDSLLDNLDLAKDKQ